LIIWNWAGKKLTIVITDVNKCIGRNEKCMAKSTDGESTLQNTIKNIL
jgi:hypothetical protein